MMRRSRRLLFKVCLRRLSREDIRKREENLRAEGIEPSCLAWKASVLPLNYARLKMVWR